MVADELPTFALDCELRWKPSLVDTVSMGQAPKRLGLKADLLAGKIRPLSSRKGNDEQDGGDDDATCGDTRPTPRT